MEKYDPVYPIKRSFSNLVYVFKIKPMEDKEMKQFSWTAFFLVTGFSFFMFSKLMLFLDGTQLPIFTWIGLAAIAVGSLRAAKSFKSTTEEE
jgi:hypothetical protein